jgi:hypothetical protein
LRRFLPTLAASVSDAAFFCAKRDVDSIAAPMR